jgi:hyperosmotically inducible periplasmic protein
MLRALFRLILVAIIVVALGAFFVGYRWAGTPDVDVSPRPTATTGTIDGIDRERARQTGAEIGERVAAGAERAQRVAAEASLTAKIKSKMTLDDTVQAGRIDVDTNGTVVTLGGSVDTPAQRARAVQLARETAGVTDVVDHLEVRAR